MHIKREIIPFVLLILFGLFAKIYFEVKYTAWILGGGLSFEELLPGYLLFLLIAIILSIFMIKKYSFKHLKILLFITWVVIFSFTIKDIGSDIYYKAWDYYGEFQVNRLKKSYEKNPIDGLRLEEVIWYSNKETVYLFLKNGKISINDINVIIKDIKPVDGLDITIQLVGLEEKKQMIYKFSNDKKFKSLENDKLLERMAQHYLNSQ